MEEAKKGAVTWCFIFAFLWEAVAGYLLAGYEGWYQDCGILVCGCFQANPSGIDMLQNLGKNGGLRGQRNCNNDFNLDDSLKSMTVVNTETAGLGP